MTITDRSNEQLQKIYDREYTNDIYKNFFTYSNYEMFREIINLIPSWVGLDVIDIGSGQGEIAAMAKLAGANIVDGVDYSQEATKIAKQRYNIEGLNFICSDFRAVTGRKYDVAVMNGVLEHFDEPYVALDYICKNICKPGGRIITSSPSFLNPRGFVWMALQLLLNVPMSLTDLHFLCPFDFEKYCDEHGYKLSYKSLFHQLAWGEKTVLDFRKRLTNALRDAKLDNSNVDRFLEWFEKTIPYAQHDNHTGALVAYLIET
jgi:2-polyprenyl-3-methyl-5-hydroxy-6-metoxy-1,4-benzoquinol methylase